jgi:hypothetical protein
MQVLGSLQKLGTDSNLLRRVAAGQVRWLIEFWLMLTVKWGSSLKFITFLDSFRIDPAMDCGVYWGITASVTEFELELQWKHLTCQPFLSWISNLCNNFISKARKSVAIVGYYTQK